MKPLFVVLPLLLVSSLSYGQQTVQDSLPGKSYDNSEQIIPTRVIPYEFEEDATEAHTNTRAQFHLNTLKQQLVVVDAKITDKEKGQKSATQNGQLVQPESLEELKKKRKTIISEIKKADPSFKLE